jgi:hypothetical protein
MTIPIKRANIPTSQVVSGLSRYQSQTVIYYGEQKLIAFDTYIRKKYVASGKERVMLLTKGIEYRPDLVSFDVFGTTDAWWKILEANHMQDIWEFKAGTTIIIPDSVL